MPYSLKAVKSGPSREGKSFYANLYFGTKKIGSLKDEGNGGAPLIDFDTRALGEEHIEALRDWAVAHDSSLNTSSILIDMEEAVFGVLENIYENNKRATKGVLFIKENTSDPFEREKYFIKGKTLSDKGLIEKLKRDYPQSLVWDSALEKYVPTQELVLG